MEEVAESALAALPFVAIGLLVVASLWALGARSGVSGLRFWPGFVLALTLGPLVGSLAAAPLCAPAVSAGVRPMTVELVTSEIALVIGALALLWTQREHAGAFADDAPRWGALRTFATGVTYLFLWIPRALFLLAPLLAILASSDAAETAPIAEVLEGARAGPIDAVLTLLAAAVLAPIAEEALFRGALAPHLARYLGAWPALYLSAIVFGAMHLGGHGPFLLGPLAIGCVLAWARLRSRGLAVPIALHAMLNGIATGLMLSM